MDSKQDRTPLLYALQKFQQRKPTYFCIPGHRYEEGVSSRWLKKEERAFLNYDFTETSGLDDLHDPHSVIKESQELLAELYHSRESYFLVNGTSCGNEAMLLATLREGEKVLVPSNAHKSIFSGLLMSGARPVYINPVWMQEEYMWGGVEPQAVEKALCQDPEIKAVFLVSPTYYGMTSCIEEIAEICHKKGVPLLVDEAHGAHLYFSDKMPKGALSQGADMCTQSFHKVTGALTQSSVLHTASDYICAERVRQALQMVQSSSPSYLLMASLDAARYEFAVRGKEELEKTLLLAESFRDEINSRKNLCCIQRKNVQNRNGVRDMDPLRLTIRVKGCSGYWLQEYLQKQQIETELADSQNVLAIVTPANSAYDLTRLKMCLLELDNLFVTGKIQEDREKLPAISSIFPAGERKETIMTPREVWNARVTSVNPKDAAGRIAAEMIIPYPPGIPLVRPGEVITSEILQVSENLRKAGKRFHGFGNSEADTIKVVID